MNNILCLYIYHIFLIIKYASVTIYNIKFSINLHTKKISPMSFTNLINLLKNLLQKILHFNILCFKFYLKLQLKLIWFFTETKIGYCIYLFCIMYGVSGLSSTKNEVIKAWCILFAITIAGLVVQWYILVKIPFTKKLLENWLTREYIVNHFGEY